jgi:hypothetical protein
MQSTQRKPWTSPRINTSVLMESASKAADFVTEISLHIGPPS